MGTCSIQRCRSHNVDGSARPWVRGAIVAFCLVLAISGCAATGVRAGGDELQTEIRKSDLIVRPDGLGPFPAVIMLHGCSGLGRRDQMWAGAAARLGLPDAAGQQFRGAQPQAGLRRREARHGCPSAGRPGGAGLLADTPRCGSSADRPDGLVARRRRDRLDPRSRSGGSVGGFSRGGCVLSGLPARPGVEDPNTDPAAPGRGRRLDGTQAMSGTS